VNGPLPAVALTAYMFALVVTRITAPVLLAWVLVARLYLVLARVR
jgi:hypothetical protein